MSARFFICLALISNVSWCYHLSSQLEGETPYALDTRRRKL
jgi:hypothetical protein